MLQLYTFKSCMFCERVRRAFAEMGIEYEEVLAEMGTPAYDELVKLGGRGQVPFLVDEDNNVSMYESNDIIAYAEKHFA